MVNKQRQSWQPEGKIVLTSFKVSLNNKDTPSNFKLSTLWLVVVNKQTQTMFLCFGFLLIQI